MVRALRSLGANVGWFLPGRIDDGYGLSADTVARLAGAGLRAAADRRLRRSPPSRRSRRARAGGLDVVVTDHHAPRADGRLPDCPIVHPASAAIRAPICAGPASPTSSRRRWERRPRDEDVELVALATVADLMPLRGENRRLVRAGLAAMANTGQARACGR